ncbi:hypothetical protein acdb102_09000 [Acidothermaceae bacterium B102]|nr:hypothetical protein acdb102_09000 [Acidothermaceae bacterium B102]
MPSIERRCTTTFSTDPATAVAGALAVAAMSFAEGPSDTGAVPQLASGAAGVEGAAGLEEVAGVEGAADVGATGLAVDPLTADAPPQPARARRRRTASAANARTLMALGRSGSRTGSVGG